MKTLIYTFLFSGILFSCNSPNQDTQEVIVENEIQEESAKEIITTNYVKIDSDELLIATALLAAPAESRENCKVIGYNTNGEFVTLKKGTNEFICLADNPSKEGFSAACYYKSLEPFMARGRELKAEGKNHQEIFDIREEEVKSGKLEMGKAGSTLHIYFGDNKQYDAATKSVPGAIYRYVVYLPWATSASTGLPEKPHASNHPWIMNPGTHKAHIMISPISTPAN